MHPQSSLVSVSYPQGLKDLRPNFEKFQNSGADEQTVLIHNSERLSIAYPYLTHHYIVRPRFKTDPFHADHRLMLR